ncbi:type II secretion system protein [Phycisphaerales bacterium AB-hyl4]|uniref:Type II secretion system protein n=1 Tax=Natronomicrosphaera hydrolytica TaxID=3242702 RepID=A0ABV4U9S0_9BACT
MPRSSKHAFALIELLVVISIITLLVGLMLPVLSQVRSAGQRIACLSNLRQVGIGFEAYRIDFNNRMPAVQAMPVLPDEPSLMDVMEGYLDAAKIWQCPADDSSFAENGTSYEYFMGYYLIFTQGSADYNDLLRELHAIESIMPVLTDADGWHPNGPGGTSANALFLDGRADWFHVTGDD